MTASSGVIVTLSSHSTISWGIRYFFWLLGLGGWLLPLRIDGLLWIGLSEVKRTGVVFAEVYFHMGESILVLYSISAPWFYWYMNAFNAGDLICWSIGCILLLEPSDNSLVAESIPGISISLRISMFLF